MGKVIDNNYKSDATFSQGWDGNGEVMRGSLGGVNIFMHSGHCWMKLLISLEMFSHHTDDLARRRQRCMPWWP